VTHRRSLPSRPSLRWAFVSLIGTLLGLSRDGLLLPSPIVPNPQGTAKLGIEDLIAMRRILAAQIAPDGSQVALTIEEAAPEGRSKDGAYSSLWLVSTDRGESHAVTATPGVVASPQWAADSRRIAFICTKPGELASQVCVVGSDGGGFSQLTHHPSAVAGFSWSPDGRQIAFVAAEPEAKAPEELKKFDLGYDAIDVGPSEPVQRRHPRKLFLLDLDSGQSRPLDVQARHVISVHWSPNGTELLLTVAAQPYPDWELLRPQIVTVSPAGGTPELYCVTQGKLQGLSWAPDGNTIAFLGSLENGTDFFPNGLFVCQGQGSAPRDLSAGSTFAVESFRWMPDSQSLLVAAAEGGRRSLAKLDLPTRRLDRLADEPGVLSFRSDYSVSRSTGRIAAVFAKSDMPPELWTAASARATGTATPSRETSWKKLTRLNPHLEARTLGQGEVVGWKAQDGWDISGILIKPPGYRPGTRYPMIVYLHGSNGGEANDFHLHQNDWGQLLAADGYAVLLPNYRGSIMGSSTFRRGARGDYGGKDLLDILAGVDSMIERGIADPKRLGVAGISYGGYLTNLCATKTTRFQAAVSVAGFSNWVTFHGGESSAPEAAEVLEWGKSTYENFNLLWQHSPIAHVSKSRTPILLIMGELDPGIPLAQGTHLFRGQRHFGVPSQLIVYPREGHGLREPNHLRDYYRRILDWFGKHLQNARQ